MMIQEEALLQQEEALLQQEKALLQKRAPAQEEALVLELSAQRKTVSGPVK